MFPSEWWISRRGIAARFGFHSLMVRFLVAVFRLSVFFGAAILRGLISATSAASTAATTVWWYAASSAVMTTPLFIALSRLAFSSLATNSHSFVGDLSSST